MNLITAKQITPAEMLAESADLLVAASGYETRARFFSERFGHVGIPQRIAFGFSDRLIFSRKTNDNFFRSQNFELIDGHSGDTSEVIAAFLKKRIEEILIRSNRATLWIDISSMTKCWYSGIVKILSELAVPNSRVRCVFNYSPSDYSPPPALSSNSVVGPLPGYCNLSAVDQPVALVLGLGYDRIRGTGLLEYLDPSKAVLFYTNPTYDPRFIADVEKNNEHLFKSVGVKATYAHPIWDLDFTMTKLIDVVSDLSRDHRVVIAPLGVKPFALISMLAVQRFQNADVWRVSGSTRSAPIDRNPIGENLLYEVVFESEPED